MENQNGLYDLCDYMLAWTLSQYEKEEYQEEGQEISLEVRDRAISVIGIGVPMGLYVFCIYMLCVLLGAVRGVISGKRK